jgi:spore coat polysaccharide biosynthesis predicted glycosyltransferase SpsG
MLIYALGDGWGHINRSLAFINNFPYEKKITLIINSPYFPLIKDEFKGINVIHLDNNFNNNNKVKEVFLKREYNTIVIDTFPLGINEELIHLIPKLQGKKTLIHRGIKEIYSKKWESFVFDNYDKILCIEDDLPYRNFPNAVTIKPLFTKNTDQFIDRKSAYNLLGISSLTKKKIIIIVGSGNPEELIIYGEIARLLNQNNNYIVRLISSILPTNCPQDIWMFYYPAIELLQVADLVISGGGYNTTNEVIALEKTMIALSFDRRFDEQEKRLIKYKKRHSNIFIARNIKDLIDQCLSLTKTNPI